MTQPPTDPTAADNSAFTGPGAYQPAAQPVYGAQQPTYAAQAAYGMPMYPTGIPAGSETKGFFGRLFDLSFKSYVTPSVVRVLFVVMIILATLTWIIYTILAFTASAGAGFAVLLLGWIGALLLIIIYRMGMEISVAIISIAENTARIR